ncbi:hypothetical protein [Flavonifractor sp. An91]|uniref:hypothetical protein n=1 Tax=Flavonifractor sp. An91 TaxID=1965665 RepID=UPI000B399687|nr:hypothetical protein [Flavonifractor sp. An91]OUN08431.1 hypothetical protein B5G42_14415 [Flavonifractor sp. An91]
MKNKNLRRISVLVTAQTVANLEKLAQMDGQPSIGRVMDKLVREKMISLRQPETLWKKHYIDRFQEVR